MGDQKAVPELASAQEQVDVKQIILGARHLVPATRGGLGGGKELVVAVTGSAPVPVTDSRYGHPAPATANTRLCICATK